MDDYFVSLAPTDLIVKRSERYDGSGFSASLKDFAPEDVSALLQTYNTVKRVYDLWLYMRDRPNYELLKETIGRIGEDQFITVVQSIGSFTYQTGPQPPVIHKVIHDIRGGSMAGLAGYAALLRQFPNKTVYIRKSVFLARDHAKMMRNAILDIDPVVRQADESARVHSINDYIEKLDDISIQTANKRIEIHVDCSFHGDISNRCLETSAIDRILYNMINNAARFSSDGKITIRIFSINDQLVRWVISNAITEQQQQWLAENASSNLSELFEKGVTRGSQGLGLSTCADFISSCFEVHPAGKAVEERYLGAKAEDGVFHIWFHWPAYIPS